VYWYFSEVRTKTYVHLECKLRIEAYNRSLEIATIAIGNDDL